MTQKIGYFDKIFAEQWSDPDNPYWKENFYTLQDNTTQKYMEATDKLNDFLQANFIFIRGEVPANHRHWK